jgi:hypothetical protein
VQAATSVKHECNTSGAVSQRGFKGADVANEDDGGEGLLTVGPAEHEQARPDTPPVDAYRCG